MGEPERSGQFNRDIAFLSSCDAGCQSQDLSTASSSGTRVYATSQLSPHTFRASHERIVATGDRPFHFDGNIFHRGNRVARIAPEEGFSTYSPAKRIFHKKIQNFPAAPVFKKDRAISLTPAESRCNSRNENGGASCGVNDVQNGAGEAFRSPSGQSAPKKGVPGDGDALLFCENFKIQNSPRECRRFSDLTGFRSHWRTSASPWDDESLKR